MPQQNESDIDMSERRSTASKRVTRCLTILQREIDELSATKRVKSITSQWGLSIRPQSLSFLLSKKHRRKRADLRRQSSKRLDRRLNPPLDHSQVLMPRFLSIVQKLIPGDPTGICLGLGIQCSDVLLDTLEKYNCTLSHKNSIFSSASTAATVKVSTEAAAAVVTAKKTTSSLFSSNNYSSTPTSSKEDNKGRPNRRSRDPKHYKLVQDAREQQNKLRQGIVLLQSRVEEIMGMVGRTTDENNLALRLGHEKTQEKLNQRRDELLKSKPPPSKVTRILWMTPILALERLLKYNLASRENSQSATDRKVRQNVQLQKFKKKAASARGLTTGINVEGFGKDFYYLGQRNQHQEEVLDDINALNNNRNSLSGKLLKSKIQKLTSLGKLKLASISSTKNFLLEKKRRSNIADRANGISSLRVTSSFHLNETLLRRFEFELLEEDRAVSQILCHLWLLSVNYSNKMKTKKSTYLDPFSMKTMLNALDDLLKEENNNRERRMLLENDLYVCWKLLTSSRVFRESQLKHIKLEKTKNQPSITTTTKKIRPKSATYSRGSRLSSSSLPLSSNRPKSAHPSCSKSAHSNNNNIYRVKNKNEGYIIKRPSTACILGRIESLKSMTSFGATGRRSSTLILNDLKDTKKRGRRTFRRPKSAVHIGSDSRRWRVKDDSLQSQTVSPTKDKRQTRVVY
jgi:hypothetical protein